MALNTDNLFKNNGILKKLCLVFLMFGFVTAAILIWIMTSSFDAGLLNYVNKREQIKLEELVVVLEDYYKKKHTWNEFIENHRVWAGILDSVIFNRPHSISRDYSSNNNPSFSDTRPPPPPKKHPRGALHSRIRLFDANKEWVAGPRHNQINNFQEYPLHYSDEIIGWLRVDSAFMLTGQFELEFKKSQQRWIWLAVLVLIFISSLLAWAVAGYFLLPIKRLLLGTKNLSNGQLGIQLDEQRNDELGELVNSFNQLSRNLAESKITRDRWVADIAHELRTPLSILHGEIQALIDGTRTLGPASLNSLLEEVQSLSRLIDDLYQLSITDLGDMSYRFGKVNLIDLLDSVIDSYISGFDMEGLSLEYKKNNFDEIIVNADTDRLVQLFNNLLVNSIRYTKSPGKVMVLVNAIDKQSIIIIKDTAPKVSDDDLTYLFDRLFRAESSRSRRFGGAGLGLSICKNIVNAHKGTIVAEHSELGGLKITIKLPLVIKPS